MKSNNSFVKSRYLLVAGVCMLVLIAVVYLFFFAPVSRRDADQYIYVDGDDTADSVVAKVEAVSGNACLAGFRTLIRHSSYRGNVRTGRYAILTADNSVTLFRKLRNGRQDPLNITIPSVRTKDRLAEFFSSRLMMDGKELLDSLNSPSLCQTYGLDTATIICMFIPNTYQMFWDVSVSALLGRMQREAEKFWTADRKAKAAALKLSPEEVITLASIVDEETSRGAEKPMIAGMYYNRLQTAMPLQADPTIKFARRDFAARRIYRAWLQTDSPYNTYKNTGLPPGPIRIPTVEGIDAVLNMAHHDYLYMCAKEDFSGTHNFAKTYAEHQKNAARYSAALNARGIE